jgi:hypothetical protein
MTKKCDSTVLTFGKLVSIAIRLGNPNSRKGNSSPKENFYVIADPDQTKQKFFTRYKNNQVTRDDIIQSTDTLIFMSFSCVPYFSSF